MAEVKVLTPIYGCGDAPIVIGPVTTSPGSAGGGVYIGHDQTKGYASTIGDNNVFIGDDIAFTGSTCDETVAIGRVGLAGRPYGGVCIGLCAYLGAGNSVSIGYQSICQLNESVVILGNATGSGCAAIVIGHCTVGNGDVCIGFPSGSSMPGVAQGYRSMFIGSAENYIAINGCSGEIIFCIKGCGKSISATNFFNKLGI